MLRQKARISPKFYLFSQPSPRTQQTVLANMRSPSVRMDKPGDTDGPRYASGRPAVEQFILITLVGVAFGMIGAVGILLFGLLARHVI